MIPAEMTTDLTNYADSHGFVSEMIRVDPSNPFDLFDYDFS